MGMGRKKIQSPPSPLFVLPIISSNLFLVGGFFASKQLSAPAAAVPTFSPQMPWNATPTIGAWGIRQPPF
jgi:hypothetical protein